MARPHTQVALQLPRSFGPSSPAGAGARPSLDPFVDNGFWRRLLILGIDNATIVVTVDEGKLRAGAGEAGWTPAAPSRSGRPDGWPATPASCRSCCPVSRILDLGMTRRLFDGHQRLALATPDQGCVFPGCERPAVWCEAHHRIPWSEGGAIEITNGCLLCSFHHHLIHQGEWDLVLAADRITEVIPPKRIDQQRRPTRHQRFNHDPADPSREPSRVQRTPGLATGPRQTIVMAHGQVSEQRP